VFRQAGGQRGDFCSPPARPAARRFIQYVTKALIGVLRLGHERTAGRSDGQLRAANSPITNVGNEHPNIIASGSDDPLIKGLEGLGHTVFKSPQISGIATIVVRSDASGDRY